MFSIRRLIGLSSVLFVLSACGGGGSSGDSGGQTPPPATQYIVGGIATGVSGQDLGIVLRLNGEDPIQISSDGEFSFPKALPAGSTYQARLTIDYVFEDGQKRCALMNSDGTVSVDSNSILNLRCVPAALRPSADFSADGLVVNWTDIGAQQYNAFAMPLGVSDVRNYSSYPGAEMAPDVIAPLLAIQTFSLGEWSFIVEAEFEDGHRFNSTPVNALNATPLGGIITEPTTLRKSASPYKLFDDLQIGSDVTLQIDPGTHLHADWKVIGVFGALRSAGLEDDIIVLHEAIISSGLTPQQDECPTIDLSFTRMNQGALFGSKFTGGTGTNCWSWKRLTNSVLISVQMVYGLSGSQSASSPLAESLIARNIFVDGYQQLGSIGTSASLTIENNVFFRGTALQTYLTPDETTRLVFTKNSILAATYPTINMYNYSWNGFVTMDVTNNYWGTTDESEIQAMINDVNTNLALSGEAVFKPFLTAPHPETPEFDADEFPLSD